MTLAEQFCAWALDSARTREERYGVELLIEALMSKWRNRQNITFEPNYEAERLRKKERQLNPAYEPRFAAEDVEHIAEVLDAAQTLSFSCYDDRSLRDLKFLQFVPGVESLSLANTEIADWAPVAGLKALTSLAVTDRVAQDLRPIGELTQLESLSFYLDCPWPDLTGLERLVNVRSFSFYGNPLALAAIPRLPAVWSANVQQVRDFKVPLRSVADLPEMPELRRLELINAWRLDGIERSPRLINLEVYGYFDDLTPLAGLRELTHLMISGGYYESLAPLAGLPSLRWLKVRNEKPRDFSVLAEMPRLHEVEIDLCPANKLEVAALNAGLTPWTEEFAMSPPRPLAPLRLRLERPKDEPQDDSPGRTPRDWGEDAAMAKSEARWFLRECHRRLTALLGKGWGKIDYKYSLHAGHDHFSLTRTEDIDRLGEVVECLREMIATARHPWRFWLHADSLARYERGMDEIEDDEEDQDEEENFDAERERDEWEWRQKLRRERRAYIEREYRYRLQQQQGVPIRPEDFAPPKREDKPIPTNEDDGGPEYDLGTRLSLYATITETSVFIVEHDRALAELLLDMKAEEPPPKQDENPT